MEITSSKLKESWLAKITVIFIITLFLVTPLAPVLAQEISPDPAPAIETSFSPAPETISTPEVFAEEPIVEPAPVEEILPAEEDKLKEKKPKEKKPKEKEPEMETMMMQSSSIGPVGLIGDISESQVGRLSSQIDNTSGALVYRYDVVVPPGRNDMTPELALIYRSTNSAQDSVVGSGWNFNIPHIQRVNKQGSDKLYSEDHFVSSLDGELILISGSTYAPKYENGDFRKYDLTSNVWTVTEKNGTVFTFGSTASARQDNPSDSSEIYKWMLEETRDTNDNYISYGYYKDTGQIYPAVITYTGNNTTDGIFDINFVRVSRSGAPVMFDTGFSVQSNYRISEVNIEINDSWVRKYTLSYTTGDNNIGSFLDTVIESGRDESAVTTTLPAVNFDYSISATDWTYDSSLAIPLPFTETGADYGMRTADINGDGLLDIICHNGKSSGTCRKNYPIFYLNTGNGWTDVSSTWSFPITEADLSGDQEYFTESNGADAGLRAIDVNGDLKVDLVRGKVGFGKFVYLNNGSGWTYDATWDLLYAFVGSSGEDFGMRMGDINGDGLPDVVCHNDKTSGVSCPRSQPQVYLNNGSGWVDVSSTWLFPIQPDNPPRREYFVASGFVDAGLRLVDVNGDGLADLVRANDSTKYTYINNGSGWTHDADWDMPLSFVYSGIYSGKDPGLRMADVNGDGLIDVLCHNLSTATGVCTRDHPYIHLNNGNGWDDVSTTWEFPGAEDNSPYKEAFLTDSYTDTGLRVFDINGDGIDDFVRGSESSKYTYTNNEDIPTNLLTNVTYPQGGNTSITYKATPLFTDSFGNLLNPNMPIISHVVSKVSTSDGIATTIQNEYKYTGGEYYFDDYLDRRFAGFSTIERTDSGGNAKKTYYHQGNTTNTTLGEYDDHVSKIGKAYRLEEYDDSSNLYRLSVDKIDKYNIGTDHDFVKAIRHTTLDYDGNGDHADTTSEYTYDNTYGNITEKIDWGKVTASTDGSFTDTGSDKMTRDISYTSNTANYIVGLPYQDTVVDQGASKVGESKTYYDAQSLGSVTIGNPTKVEDWVAGSTYINNQKTYDGTYGLVATATDPRGKVTTYTTYDTYNLYPITITNPLSQTLQYTYDYSLGKPKQTTDPNGFVYQTVYDGLDRVKEEKIPGFTSPYTPVTKTAYAYTDTSGAVKVQRTDHLDGSISTDTYQYLDGLGRLIQERKEAENNYNVKDTVYNNVGLIQKQSLPYNSSGSSKTSATGTTSLYKNYTYDALKRPVTIIDTVGTTSYAYDDWKTTVTDVANNVKHYYKDARENLIKVDEVNGASTYTTNYEWNLNNKLTKITDALSNVRNFTYDGLGRRLTAEDLHASADGTYGTWTYVYDDAGNLTQSVSPRSLTTNYTYNDINQQLTEDYTGAGGTEITYTYSGCTKGTAKLCSVTMTSGANTSYTYDSNGNVASEAKTINSTAYTTSYTYDRQGNKLVITYPDSAEVRYTFNTAGLLDQIERKESGGAFTDVVSNFDYSPLDQITTQTDANGVTTTNTYDATKLYRLTRRLTQNTVPTKHQDLNYTYDGVGNITSIIEASDTDAAREIYYTYDDLYRLTQSSMLTSGGGGSEDWFDNSWGYRVKVTIPSGEVSSDLTDFPIYVDLSHLPSGFHDNVKTDGGDIRVTRSDGTTELSREVTNYNPSTDTGELHVRYAGTLYSAQDNELYIYYGNSAVSDYASTDTYGSEAVWADYNFASHEGGISDVTGTHSPSNNGTTQSTDAKVGSTSRDYERSSSQYITLSDSTSLDLTGDFTLDAWVKFEDLSQAAYFFWSHYQAANSFTDFYYNKGSGKIFISSIYNGSWGWSGYVPYTFSTGTWYHIVFKGKAGGGTVDDFGVYVNGTDLGDITLDVGSFFNAWGNQSGSIHIGRQGNASNYMDGLFDEFRLRSNVLSASWITAEYSNQGDPSNFYTVGIQETDGALTTRDFVYNAIGNITSGPAGTYTYAGTDYANPHAATTINSVTYSYDNDGNLTGNGTLSNTWNYKDQLTQAVVGAVTSDYLYDHAGERASLANGTVTIAYPNDLYNYDGTKKTKQIYADKDLIATIETVSGTATPYYNHTDHLNSVTTVSDSSGALAETLDYYPFGDQRISSGSYTGQRQYIGQLYDADTDLDYLNARYYKSDIGRFISQDPVFWNLSQELLSDPQQQNSYSYARNNPIVMKDPSGLLTVVVPGTDYNTKDWSSTGNAKNFINNVGKTFNETPQILQWSGGNNLEARNEAALSLVNLVNNYSFAEGEKLNIVGHSHGGNVVLTASQNPDMRQIDTLVTLGTPNRTNYQPSEKVDRHINAYSRFDIVQKLGEWGDPLNVTGADSRKFDGAENVGVGLRAGVSPRGSHTNLWQNKSVWSKINKKLKSKKK
jgi:RHS repeat-associated protein